MKDCLARFRAEVNPCKPWFSVKDPSTDRALDIQASFAPAVGNYNGVLIWKFFAVSMAITDIVKGVMVSATPGIFFAFLTNWAVMICTLYLLLSLYNTAFSSRTTQPDSDTVDLRIRWTWIFYVIGTHATAVATLMFWLIVYEEGQEIYFSTIVSHGVVLLIVVFDGMVVNRIPFRIMHWIGFVVPFDISFIMWSLIHSVTDIGNPNNNDNDPTTNDDALYPGSLEWDDDWPTAIFWSCITVFVVGFIVFILLWLLSSFSLPICCSGKDGLRYYVNESNNSLEQPSVTTAKAGENVRAIDG